MNQIDAEARDREEQLVKQMMEKQGITEKLKRQDNMEWTRRMNTICHDAEEMILTEMIYTCILYDDTGIATAIDETLAQFYFYHSTCQIGRASCRERV